MPDLSLLPVLYFERESLEYVRVLVEAARGGAEVDPSSGTAEFAFLPEAQRPVGGDWKVGEWEQAGSRWFARINVGPSGAANPGVGTWVIWARFTLVPEKPVRAVGTLVIE